MFRPPDAFIFNGTDVAQRWAKWRKMLETYFTAAEVAGKAAKVQITILLHTAGEKAEDIHCHFIFSNTENKKDTKMVLDKFVILKRTLYSRGTNSGQKNTVKVKR